MLNFLGPSLISLYRLLNIFNVCTRNIEKLRLLGLRTRCRPVITFHKDFAILESISQHLYLIMIGEYNIIYILNLKLLLCVKKYYRPMQILHSFLKTGDFHNLEPRPKDVTSSGTPEPVILKEYFNLPLSSSYLGVFLGTRGKHIKPLCTQYKVQMHLGEEGDSEGQGGVARRRRGRWNQHEYILTSSDTIKVTVCSKPEDKVDVEGFKEEMVKRAKTVTESREKHQKNVNFTTL